MAAPKKVAEPHKELRFTRAGQAQGFMVLAAISFAFCLLVGVTWFLGHPSFLWWMPLPFLGLAALLVRLSTRCAQHAYLILTPLGIEIFPLFKARENLNLVYWSQIDDAEFDEDLTVLRLHFNKDKTAGIVLSLKPILIKQRPLLKKAVAGRLAERTVKNSGTGPSPQ
jgi:hypothetical protein